MAEFPRLSLADVDSTNLEAMRRAKAGEFGPLWITAQSQAHGRGRLGRQWVSKTGNLYATLLLSPQCAPESAAGLAFVAAVSLAQAFVSLGPSVEFRLKWPNDILANNKKIAGILIETERHEDRLICVIGCGLNLHHHPEETRYPATHLAELGYDISPDAAFHAINKAFAANLVQWQQGQGFHLIREAWAAHAHAMGEIISIDLGHEILSGRFTGLALDGALQLELADGNTRIIHAGEVRATHMPGIKT